MYIVLVKNSATQHIVKNAFWLYFCPVDENSYRTYACVFFDIKLSFNHL